MLQCPALARGFFLKGAWLALILGVAAALRWYGLAWDAGYLFHPDERQIVMVASNLALPSSVAEFFSPASPLNPRFFAYGSLPIYLLRLLAPFAPSSNIVGPWANDFLARWVIFGRALSGLFDLGTLALIFLLGRRLYEARVGLLAAACVAVTVLHIQLSHFYAVDTLLTFFVMATLYAALRVAEKPTRAWKIFCGIAFGLALATKISALPLVFPIAFACYRAYGTVPLERSLAPRGRGLRRFPDAVLRALGEGRELWRALRRPLLQICAVAFAIFSVTQPYALIDWFTFGRDVGREALVARGWLDFPYTRQYANSLPYVYQVWQSAGWGMGLPLGVFAWGGAALFVWNYWRGRGWRDAFVLAWGLIYFILIGAQYVKYPRYLLPLLPLLYLMAARAALELAARGRWQRRALSAALVLVGVLTLTYALAFVSIYAREHPWLTASRWIYENVPRGAVLTVEQWDDALPVALQFADGTRRGAEYQTVALPLYAADGVEKTDFLAKTLARADVVIVASQRVYASVGRLPERYPLTVRYYEKLFGGALGFELAVTARNDPELGGVRVRDDPCAGLAIVGCPRVNVGAGVVWDWGFADESMIVYDHSQPFIFHKTRALTYAQLYELLEW